MVLLRQNPTENTGYQEEFKHTHVPTVTPVNVEVIHKVTVLSTILLDTGICIWSQAQKFALPFSI